MVIKLFLLISLSVLSVLCQSDVDQAFCDQGIIPDPNENLPFPKQNNLLVYTAEIEKNSGKDKMTTEIREYFSGANNVGVSINTFDGQTIKTISYYATDELLIINGYSCLVQKLSESYYATPFFVTYVNGTEHIVSGLTLLSTVPGLNIVFTGRKDVRGIPSKQWGTCIFDKRTNSTVRLLISYSDDDKWTPAQFQPGFKSIPLEVMVSYKNKYTGFITNEENFVTRFRPNAEIEEETYFVSSGVYCPGRSASKPFPKVPEAFTTWIEYSMPNNFSNYLEGSVRTYRNEHDFGRKLYRLDYYETNSRMTEIHDYNTGVIYKIDRYKLECQIRTIEDINSDFEPQTVGLFFETGQTPAYQYSGSRRVRGMNTDVWIAPRKYNGDDCIWEWHFMTDQWISQETNGVKTNEPVLLNIYYPAGNNNKLRLQFHFTQFDQTRIDLYDFDISICDRSIANKHVRITLNTNSYDLVKANQAAFRDNLMNAVQSFANIGLLRIGKLSTIYSENNIYAVMTLFERPNKYGPVPVKPENNLAGAYLSLKQTIDSGRFIFNFKIGNQDVSAVANKKDSLLDLADNNGRYYYVEVNTNETIGYTTGSVIAFVIVFLLIGLFVGFISGFFLILKRSSPIALPGFLNPNFSKAAPASSA